MLTYTNLITLYKSLTGDSGSDNVTLGTTLITESIRRICKSYPWKFLEASEDITTVASTQFYNWAHDFSKLVTVTFLVGTQRTPLIEVLSKKRWDLLNQSTSETSDSPSHFFVYDRQIGIYPTPTSASNTITVDYKKRVKDIGTADYTTGTVTVTNGDATVTGSGTTFTAQMVGRWFKPTTNGEWYRIASFTDATHIELDRNFEGITKAGDAYVIGDVSLLPEEYQILPVYEAVSIYWMSIGNNTTKSDFYDKKFKEGLEEMKIAFCNLSENVDIEASEDERLVDPNLFVTQ